MPSDNPKAPQKQQQNNPLHGLTLEKILTQLVERLGWDGLAARININCFKSDPSIKSSLKFLRKTQWARDKVENLYVRTFTKHKPPHRDQRKSVKPEMSGDSSPWDSFKQKK